MRLLVTLSFIISTIFLQDANACKAFAIHYDQQNFVGKSFDFDNDLGAVFINKRNVQKSAFTFSDRKANWISKFGSITFNQAGQEFPFSGMNEAGLVIEILWLEETKYPLIEKPELNESQMIQYLLDTSENTEQALLNAEKVSISQVLAPVHYFICDSLGVCAVLEYLNGKTHSYVEKNKNFNFISNAKYIDSKNEITYKLKDRSLLSEDSFKDSKSDFSNFSFSILDQLKTANWTQWQIVYDQNKKEVQFRTESQNTKRFIQLHKLDFSCRSDSRFFELNSSQTGDISNFFQVTTENANLNMLQNFKRIPPQLHLLGSRYPQENLRCLE